MRTYTAHLRPVRPPVLVCEGWSWGGALFGPIWLLAHRAWIPALIWLAAWGLTLGLPPPGLRPPILLGIALITGLLGRDMVRWSLDRRGYVLAHVVAARDEETALGRLLTARPEMADRYLDLLG